MVDLHTHILPGIDDGPPDEDTSVEFARALAADGVTTVAATPHLRADHPGVVPGELEERCGELQERLDAEEIPLRLVAGAEVDLNAAMMAGADDLRAASYGGRSDYMLVETPYNSLSRNFEDMMFRAVSSRGIGIVLAHPERNLMLQRDIDRVARLVDRGVLVQVSASALLRTERRSRSRRAAFEMLERGLVHVLASDSHGAPPRRWSSLAKAAEVAARLVSPARASWLVEDAPAAILAGLPVPAMPGPANGGKRRFGVLSRA